MPVVALAAIDAISIAITAALLIWALAYFVNVISQMIPNWNIPLLGNIRNAVAGAAQSVESTMSHYLHSAITPLENVLLWPVNVVETLFTKIYNSIATIHNVVGWVARALIPSILAAAEQFAQAEVGALSAELNGGLTNAINYTTAAAADAVGYADAYTDVVIANVRTDMNNIENFLGAQIQQAVALAQQEVGNVVTELSQVEDFLGAQIQQAVALASQEVSTLGGQLTADIVNTLTVSEQFAQNTATAAIGALVTDLDQQLTQDASAIWSGIQTGIGAVDGVIDNALPDILSGLRAIPGSIPTSLPAAITASLAISIPMLKFMEQCGIPNCKNLSQYGRDLQGVLGLAEDIGFMALFIALATDPEGAADEVANVLGPVLNGAVAAGKELLTI